MNHPTTPGATTRPCGLGVCRGNPSCEDVYCEGHPANEVHPSERDPQARRWFWAIYITGILAALVLVAHADRLAMWLLG